EKKRADRPSRSIQQPASASSRNCFQLPAFSFAAALTAAAFLASAAAFFCCAASASKRFCGAVRTDSNSLSRLSRKSLTCFSRFWILVEYSAWILYSFSFCWSVSPSLAYPDGTRCVTSGGAVLPVDFVVVLLSVGVEAGASACLALVVCDFAVLLSWAPRGKPPVIKSVIAAVLATTAMDRRARDIMAIDLS